MMWGGVLFVSIKRHFYKKPSHLVRAVEALSGFLNISIKPWAFMTM
jgi:hypothetical protein